MSFLARVAMIATTLSMAAAPLPAATPFPGPPDTSPAPLEISTAAEEGTSMPGDLNQLTFDIALAVPYVSQVWNDGEKVLEVFVSTDEESTVVENLVSSASPTTPVIVRLATHDLANLTELSNDLVGTEIGGVRITWSAPAPDGSAVDVGTDGPPVFAARPRATEPTIEGVPIRVVAHSEDPRPVAREGDASPYKFGGALMNTPKPGDPGMVTICSTGFAVSPSKGGKPAMLTAHHCGAPGSVWRTGLYTSPIVGTKQPELIFSGGNRVDIAMLQDGPDAYKGYIYWGAYNSNTITEVQMVKAPVVNDIVVYSGSRSGTTYSNVISHTNITVDYDSAGKYHALVRTVGTPGNGAVGSGDSGGPAVVPTPTGLAGVGIISGISGIVDPCQGIPASTTRKCSHIAFFAPLTAYFAQYPGSMADKSL